MIALIHRLRWESYGTPVFLYFTEGTMMMSTFLWCYNILCLLFSCQWNRGKSCALASVPVPCISSLHAKYMLLQIHRLFQESICICGVRPFQGDSCHPSIRKATFWLLNGTMEMHIRISPAWKAQFKRRKPTRASHDSRNYSSKKIFQEFETDSKLLTYLNWFRHKCT